MFSKHVVFPIPGKPATNRCGFPLMVIDQSTGKSEITSLPRHIIGSELSRSFCWSDTSACSEPGDGPFVSVTVLESCCELGESSVDLRLAAGGVSLSDPGPISVSGNEFGPNKKILGSQPAG